MSNLKRNNDIKFTYLDQTRRVRLSEEEFQAISFSSLSSLACSLFAPLISIADPGKFIILKWVDEENDIVSLSSSSELFVAMQSMQSGDRIARFEICVVEAAEKKALPVASPAPVFSTTATASVSSSSSSTSSSSPSSTIKSVHEGVTCDGCNIRPIFGLRFKCTERDDFDLCEACEKKLPRQPFPMFKIYTADQSIKNIFASLNFNDVDNVINIIKPLKHLMGFKGGRSWCNRRRFWEQGANSSSCDSGVNNTPSTSSPSPSFSSSSSSSSSSSNVDATPIHYDVTCDKCNVGPIRGIRYQCTRRENFDLCETCEGEEVQPFPMVKIYSEENAGNDVFVTLDISDRESAREILRSLKRKFHRGPQFRKPPPEAASSSSGGEVSQIHDGVRCDECGMSPIKGARFKCTQRHNFDLCEKCEKKSIQPFAMTKIYLPHQSADTGGRSDPPPPLFFPGGRGGRGGRCGSRPFFGRGPHHAGLNGGFARHMVDENRSASGINWACAFPVNIANIKMQTGQNSNSAATVNAETSTNNSIKATTFKLFARNHGDITFPGGTLVAPYTRFLKTWKICNDGDVNWPEGCVLVFDEESSSEAEKAEGATLCARDIKVPLPQAQVGEFVEVSVPLVAPERPGNYVSHFKFETADGVQFGHRVWVDIIVGFDDNNDWQILNASNSLELSSGCETSSTSTNSFTESNKQDCSKVEGNCNKPIVPAINATLVSTPVDSNGCVSASSFSPPSSTKVSTISFAAFKPTDAPPSLSPSAAKQWEWEIMQLTDMGLYIDESEVIPILVKHLKNPACTEGQKNRQRLARVINELMDLQL